MATQLPFGEGDLVYDTIDQKLCRFLRYHGGWCVLANLEFKELPDERLPIQVIYADDFFVSLLNK